MNFCPNTSHSQSERRNAVWTCPFASKKVSSPLGFHFCLDSNCLQQDSWIKEKVLPVSSMAWKYQPRRRTGRVNIISFFLGWVTSVSDCMVLVLATDDLLDGPCTCCCFFFWDSEFMLPQYFFDSSKSLSIWIPILTSSTPLFTKTG